MKPLVSLQRLRQVLDYNPATGAFIWSETLSSRAPAGSRAGSLDSQGRIQIRIDGRAYRAHRLAWLLITGDWPTREIDHRNGACADNRFDNLRDVGHRVNLENQRRPKKTNALGLLGVSPYQKRGGKRYFRARITVLGKAQTLGYFKTPEAAHAAYLSAKRAQHEGNTL